MSKALFTCRRWFCGGFLSVILTSLALQPAFCQSPYAISWPKDGIILGSGFAATFAGIAINTGLEPLTAEEVEQLSPDDINGFDRWATENLSEGASIASHALLATGLLLPATLFTSSKVGKDFDVVAVMYLEALVYTNSISTIVKGSTKRIRPFVYNPDISTAEKTNRNARRSFFSGHAANAFMAATFLSTVYGDYFPDSKWRPWVWAGSLSLAATTGYLRIVAGKHFPTDTIVGAGVGGLIGYLIPVLHRNGRNYGGSISPSYGRDQVEIRLSYSF